MKYSLREIPGGLAGTERTVREIAKHVRDDLKRPQLRLLASRLMRSAQVGSKDTLGEARTIYNFVTSRVRYQKDPVGMELVQSPLVTLQIGAGDCDDQVALVAALAQAVGIPARFRVVGYFPDQLEHIFPELNVDGRWIPADTTEPEHGFGWRPPTFPVERLFDSKGETSAMNLGQALPVKRSDVKSAVYAKVTQVLTDNWKAGVINQGDVEGYLRVIRDGNFPTKSELLVEPTERAIRNFLGMVKRKRVRSIKPNNSLSGCEGLSGFLSTVWGGVKSAVGSVIPGGGAALSVGESIVKGKGKTEHDPGEAAYYGFTYDQWNAVKQRDLVRERGFPTRESLVDAGMASSLSDATSKLQRMAVDWLNAGRIVDPKYIVQGTAARKVAEQRAAKYGSMPRYIPWQGLNKPHPAGADTTAQASGGSLLTVQLPPEAVRAGAQEAVRTGAAEFLTNPAVLIPIAALTFFLLRR